MEVKEEEDSLEKEGEGRNKREKEKENLHTTKNTHAEITFWMSKIVEKLSFNTRFIVSYSKLL